MTTPLDSNYNAINSIANTVPNLTEEEKRQLALVLQKAKEFEEEEEDHLMRKPIEGQLWKYTNVVKGYQFRWFVLTPETGMLEYYMMEEAKKSRPKGGIHLAGASVTPSEDDCHSFSVTAVYGDVYKLKASDPSERKYWVKRLTAVTQQHTVIPIEVPNMKNKVYRNHSQSPKDFTSNTSPKFFVPVEKKLSTSSAEGQLEVPAGHRKDHIPVHCSHLMSIQECVEKATSLHRDLVAIIEKLPIDGPFLKYSDSGLLLLKAVSQATVHSLEYCYLILKRQEMQLRGLPTSECIQRTHKRN